MWKIFVEYDDKSKLTLTGKHKDIPYRLAVKYWNLYVKNRVCTDIYQQYPKQKHPAMTLKEKIHQLEQAGIESYEKNLKNEIPVPLHQYLGEPVK